MSAIAARSGPEASAVRAPAWGKAAKRPRSEPKASGVA